MEEADGQEVVQVAITFLGSDGNGQEVALEEENNILLQMGRQTVLLYLSGPQSALWIRHSTKRCNVEPRAFLLPPP